jgi:hypothetical protein
MILILAAVFPISAADTGTYRILDYTATLEPQSDGQVIITYEQEWSVLSGNIPWITVGTANSNFSIQDLSGTSRKPLKQIPAGSQAFD